MQVIVTMNCEMLHEIEKPLGYSWVGDGTEGPKGLLEFKVSMVNASLAIDAWLEWFEKNADSIKPGWSILVKHTL